jgi:hypothetical protein
MQPPPSTPEAFSGQDWKPPDDWIAWQIQKEPKARNKQECLYRAQIRYNKCLALTCGVVLVAACIAAPAVESAAALEAMDAVALGIAHQTMAAEAVAFTANLKKIGGAAVTVLTFCTGDHEKRKADCESTFK